MAKKFQNMKQLERHLNRKIQIALDKEVADKVRDVQQENIEKEVYDAYNIVDGNQQEPYAHERRRSDGGLSDRDNMISRIISTGGVVQLSITNMTQGADSDMYIAGLVEYGHGRGYGHYDYTRNRDGTQNQYLGGRPFLEETRNELQRTNAHSTALRKGLIRQGLRII